MQARAVFHSINTNGATLVVLKNKSWLLILTDISTLVLPWIYILILLVLSIVAIVMEFTYTGSTFEEKLEFRALGIFVVVPVGILLIFACVLAMICNQRDRGCFIHGKYAIRFYILSILFRSQSRHRSMDKHRRE